MKFVFTDKKVNLPNKVHAYAEKKVGKLDRHRLQRGEGPEQRGAHRALRQHDHPRV